MSSKSLHNVSHIAFFHLLTVRSDTLGSDKSIRPILYKYSKSARKSSCRSSKYSRKYQYDVGRLCAISNPLSIIYNVFKVCPSYICKRSIVEVTTENTRKCSSAPDTSDALSNLYSPRDFLFILSMQLISPGTKHKFVKLKKICFRIWILSIIVAYISHKSCSCYSHFIVFIFKRQSKLLIHTIIV